MVRTYFQFSYSRSLTSCSDYNFIRQDDKCVPAGPEPIPAGVCAANDPKQTFMGSSGYRLIPGDTCDREEGLKKDEKVEKSCAEGAHRLKAIVSVCMFSHGLIPAEPPEGEVIHQTVRNIPTMLFERC